MVARAATAQGAARESLLIAELRELRDRIEANRCEGCRAPVLRDRIEANRCEGCRAPVPSLIRTLCPICTQRREEGSR